MTTTPLDPTQFRSEVTFAVHRFRRALADVIASAGGSAAEPRKLARQLELDRTLMWRVSRAIREEDAIEALPHLPGRSSIRAMLLRLEECGASPAAIASVREAAAGFERFVELHSGDRETLAMMLGRVDRPSAAKQMELFRRQGFRANSAVWGVQARIQFSVHLLTPGADATLRIAIVVGFVELRRLRPDVPWAIGTVNAWNEVGSTVEAGLCPLFPETAVEGVPLLPEFCSRPMPGVRARPVPSGGTRFEITHSALGHVGAVDTVLGWRFNQPFSIRARKPGENGEHGAVLYTPVELLIHDLLVHRTLEFAHRPSAVTYSRMPGGPEYPAEGPDAGRLPLPEEITDLGCPPSATAPEIPRYADLLGRVADRVGSPLHEFRAFRRRVKYPSIPSLAILRHPLLPPLA